MWKAAIARTAFEDAGFSSRFQPQEDGSVDRLEILARAWTVGVNVEGLDKVEAIRAIQRAEGYQACFGCGCSGTCGQPGCAFRNDCELIKIIDDPCQIVACDLPGPVN